MFPQKIHRYIFLFGIVSAPFGVLVGRAPGSWPIIILATNWLLEGQFTKKWERLRGNSIFWTLLALFVLYVLGLLYTENLDAGLDEFRIGLPLIILPITVFSSEKFSAEELRLSMYSLIAGCVISSLWCILYGFVLHHVEAGRNLSRFMSHIRFGMYINLGISACIYYGLKSNQTKVKIALSLIAIYLVFTLFILGLASGIVMFALLLLCAFLYGIYQLPMYLKMGALIVMLSLGFMAFKYVQNISEQQLKVSDSAYNQLKTHNAQGKSLLHFDSLGILENGNYVYRNIEMQDLRKAWNKRVPEDSFGYASETNLARYHVLLRYLSSAYLNKDDIGVRSLCQQDIENIKNNISNKDMPQWSYLHKRIYELVNEYDDFKQGRDVNGHSLAMRLVFWKASLLVLKEQAVFGVGTGDVQDELNKVYKMEFNYLSETFYLKPHNQFLSIALAFGLVGLLGFIFILGYPFVFLRRHSSSLYRVFLAITLLSFVTEDTLGTQAGLDFYAIFNVVFCAEAYFKKQQTLEGLQ